MNVNLRSEAANTQAADLEPRGRLKEFLSRLAGEKPLGAFCGCVILLLILIGILAPVISPYPYEDMHLIDRLQGPSSSYLLGTDHIGRDQLSRLMHGARISLFAGLSATTLSVIVSLMVGGVSGFVGGKVDLVLQRIVDAWMAFPGLLLLLTIMSIVGLGLLQIIVVLGVSGGVGGSRITRGAVIAIKGNDYFFAARAIGSRADATVRRHVVPNIMPVLIIGFSISIGGVILAVSALSFLGYGLPPGSPDWGSMLSQEGRQYMEQAPWLALFPGLSLTIVIYCLNMFGDAMRDLLDPRLRGGER